MNFIQPEQRGLPLSNRVNLDELFGNIVDNTICEPLTPFKMAVYLLVRNLHDIHDEPTIFSNEDLNKIHSVLYGILENGDMPFVDLRRIVRFMDKTIHEGIYTGLLYCIGVFIHGGEFNITLDRVLRKKRRRARLCSSRSPLAAWLKKLYIAWVNLSPQETFNLLACFRQYVQDAGGYEVTVDFGLRTLDHRRFALKLPREIESSTRARKWIDTQIHLMQVCPSAAVPQEKLFEWCELIHRHHIDITQVHLLEMLIHLRMKNEHDAHKALRKCFDYGMFRPNIRDAMIMPTGDPIKRMGDTDQRPLRFGPLLHARLYRIFGEKDIARCLLTECVQQSQAGSDRTSLRMAMVELLAIEQLPPSRADKEHAEGRMKHGTDRSLLTSCKYHDYDREMDPPDSPISNAGDFTSDQKDTQALQQQLYDASQMLDAVSQSFSGDFRENLLEALSSALKSSCGDDTSSRGRLMSEAATSLLTSFRIQRGLWRSARSTAISITESNYSDGIAPHFETEAQAVAMVNIVYSHAAEGNWDAALSFLEKFRSRFSDELNWQTARHVTICSSLIMFDNNFRRGLYKDCEEHLVTLEAEAPEEAFLRRAMLMAQQGRVSDSVHLIQERMALFDERTTLIFQMRMRMQLSMLLANHGQYDSALEHLRMVREKATQKGLELFDRMAARRQTVIHMQSGEPTVIDSSSFSPDYYCREVSQLEMAVVYIGFAKAYIANKRDKNSTVKMLALARLHCQRAGYPLLEKSILHDIARWYNHLGELDKRDDICEQLCDLNDKHPGAMDWTLF